MTPRELINVAERARERAHAPYSRFCVGAALLTADGKVFEGCNIENSSYSVTLCAERTAIAAAVSAGYKDLCAIAIVGANEGEDTDSPCYPCGACRQFMEEFCSDDFLVYLKDKDGEIREVKLEKLLPFRFKL